MHTRHLSPTAKKILNSLRDEAVDRFDSHVIRNSIHDHLREDDQLLALVQAVAEAQHAQAVRDREYDGSEETIDAQCEHAADVLHRSIGQRLVERIAEECLTVLVDGDGWREEGWVDQDELAEAQHEAARWLNSHAELSKQLWGTERPAANHEAHAGP